MKLIIQIPRCNEEKVLNRIYMDSPKRIDNIVAMGYRLINDDSSDRTVEVAHKIDFNHIVNFKSNKGLANGLGMGVKQWYQL